jgi:hypothetical protein
VGVTEFQPQQVGKLILMLGIVLSATGILIILLSKTDLFRLPGDIHLEGKNWKIYFPIVSCLVISIVLTVIVWIVHSLRR